MLSEDLDNMDEDFWIGSYCTGMCSHLSPILEIRLMTNVMGPTMRSEDLDMDQDF